MLPRSYGPPIMFIGMAFLLVRIVIHEQMQQIVAKLAPPKTNRPLKNLIEAIDYGRVRREFRRLFPKQARKKFLVVRVTTIIGILFLLAGLVVAR